PSRNSCVVVEHAGTHFSIYTHVRKGSAIVKVGQAVKAGDVLGRVGNAGSSSEPHLHFGYLGLDRTGRFRSIPVRIEGLRTVDGKPADGGVPKGGVEYVSAAGK
ncbi:MAG TPA: M23 family metallopeptidase, partial [Isosphaeraceae bacterium]